MYGIDEKKKWIRELLQRSGSPCSAADVDRLCAAVTASRLAFTAGIDVFPSRDAHDQLRTIWKLVRQRDPPIGQIRARLSSLPAAPRAYLEQRASRVRRDLFPSDNDFIRWTQDADASELLPTVRLVIAEGACLVVGRKRANARRSAARIEPVIMGVVRGSDRGLSQGGRPRATAVDTLVMHLAVDWAQATGWSPGPGRGEAEPFGDLVHQVFSWIDQRGADQALRRYWDSVRREAARPSLTLDD